ncbi:MAG: hypothetical protein GY874_14040 [Desulfobacteraceae bacterium]|nr:hypothetical protein [Desulfobacteraceae bacterium]
MIKNFFFKILKPMTIILLIFTLLFAAYLIFIQSFIQSWGATEDELNMPLLCDNKDIPYSSTRSITINKPANEIWKWIVQIGPDRAGFYSYTFIEKLFGYEVRHVDKIVPEYQSMSTKRFIPRSSNEGWQVTAVDPGRAFVLENWGAFVLKPIDENTTRLIIRTHGRKNQNIKDLIKNIIIEASHFIMERRMMIGIKELAEAGGNVSIPSKGDYIWFYGIIISFFSIIVLSLINQSISGILATGIFSLIWILSVFFIIPQPLFVISLLLIIASYTFLKTNNSIIS